MSNVKLPLLQSEEASLEIVLDDLEAALGEDIVCMLRVTGTYDRFMGYACEVYLGDVQLAGSDPLYLNKRDYALLARLVRAADARRQDGSDLSEFRVGKRWSRPT